jgi:uncharacterized membrane protein
MAAADKPGDAQIDGQAVVAEVDGVKLTRAEFERSNPARLFQPRNTYHEAERKALDEYASEYLLERQARKENLADITGIKRQDLIFKLLKERVKDLDQLAAAIRVVADGGSVIDPKVIDALVAENARGEASPLNQLLALAALVACWKSGPKARLYFGLAFLLAVLTDALTFAYFYPRNEILFRAAQSNADVFTKICSEWSTMNWVRSIILAFGLVCSMKGLDAYYVKAQPRTKAMDGT